MTVAKENMTVYKKAQRKIFNPTEAEIKEYSSTYAYCCASFHVLLENLENKDYFKSFQKVLLNQATAKYERTNLEVVDKIDTSFMNKLPDEGFILCSFHFSAYQIISPLLIKKNRKYFIVVNNSDSNNQDTIEKNIKGFKSAKKRYKNTVQENIIHLYTNEKDFVFRARDLLNDGYVMLVFIDGNSGLDGIMKSSNKNLEKISFLQREIFVRKGIPILSYSFKVPIIPIFSIRDQDNQSANIFISDPIIPDLSLSRDQYCNRTIKYLYNLLEQYVKSNPFDWEGWLYIYKWLDIKSLQVKNSFSVKKIFNSLEFNTSKYIKFQINENYFLLDKDTHLSYEIDIITYNKLEGILDTTSISADDLEELKEMKILI